MKTKSSREEILQEIKKAKVKEELAIPLYVSHIKEVLFWSGISDDKKNKIIQSLKILETESEMHVVMLKRVEDIFIKSLE